MSKKKMIEWDKSLWECEEGLPEDELDPDLFSDYELEQQVLSEEDMLLLDGLGLDDSDYYPDDKLVGDS